MSRPDPVRPRLPAMLAAAPVVLADEAAWEGTKVGGSFAGREASHVDVVGCHLHQAAFTATEIDRLRLTDTLVEECELSGAVLPRLAVVRVAFRRCRMSGVVAAGATFYDVHFSECKIDEANFRTATFVRSRFDDCGLAQADFGSANLAGTRFHRCDLTGADFDKAKMAGASLHGSTLEGLRGAGSLNGIRIAGDQVLPIAYSVFSALGIRITDLDDDGEE